MSTLNHNWPSYKLTLPSRDSRGGPPGYILSPSTLRQPASPRVASQAWGAQISVAATQQPQSNLLRVKSCQWAGWFKSLLVVDLWCTCQQNLYHVFVELRCICIFLMDVQYVQARNGSVMFIKVKRATDQSWPIHLLTLGCCAWAAVMGLVLLPISSNAWLWEESISCRELLRCAASSGLHCSFFDHDLSPNSSSCLSCQCRTAKLHKANQVPLLFTL